MKLPKFLLVLAALLATSLSAFAQNAPGPGPLLPPPNSPLGAELRQLIQAHRQDMAALMQQRRGLLENLRNAAPEEREALRLQLRDLMREQQKEQRELAKAIRDTIRARRDAQRPTPPSGG